MNATQCCKTGGGGDGDGGSSQDWIEVKVGRSESNPGLMMKIILARRAVC